MILPLNCKLPHWPPLAHAAADAGVDEVTFLAMASAVLTGLAPPESGWDLGHQIDHKIAPNIIIPSEGVLQLRGLADLLSLARLLQERLRHTSGQFRQEILEAVRYGRPGRRPDGPWETDPARIHTQALRYDATHPDEPVSLAGSFEHDLKDSVSAIREEALRHPTILLSNPKLAELRTLMESCHLGRSLVCGTATDLLLANVRKGRKAGEPSPRNFADYIQGFDHVLTRGKGLTPLGGIHYCQASTIIQATQPELALLAGRTRTPLDQFAIVQSRSPAAQGTSTEANSHTFLTAFNNAVKSLVDTRRAGLADVRGLRSPENAQIFRRRHLEFLRSLEEAKTPAAGLANLPLAMAWTLSALVPNKDMDAVILGLVFPYAKALLKRHVTAIEEAGTRQRVAKQPEREVAIVQRISERGPLTFRELVRSFSRQKKALYEPAVKRLVAEGVILRDDEGLLSAGPTISTFQAEHTATTQ